MTRARGIGERLAPKGLYSAATFLALILASPALALTAPTPGAILQPTQPPATLPAAPGGVVHVPPPTQQKKTGARLLIPIRKLEIKGNHWLPTAQLHALVAPAEGQRLNLDQLNAVIARISDAYRSAGYPVAYAYLPAQTIRNGEIRVKVVEPRYDRIILAGPSRLSDARTRATVGIKPGDPVAEAPLSRGLLLLRETPGLNVKGVLVPGAQPGTSALKLMRKDQPVLSGSIAADNHGNSTTGRGLAHVAVTASNPFGWGSALSANALRSDSGGLTAGGISAISPDLGRGLRAGIYGSASNYHLGGAFAALDQIGRSEQAGLDLSYPLVLQPGRRLDLRFDALKSWLTQDTRSTGALAHQQVTMARLSLSGALRDRRGNATSGRIGLNFGHLGLSPATVQAADAAGPQAAGSFALIRFQLSRAQRLGRGFTLQADLSGQISNRNLDSSRQFYLGGPDGVMSTDVGTGGGDEGLLLNLRLAHRIAAQFPGRLKAALIGQYGAVKVNHSTYPGASAPGYLSAAALGLSLDYTRGRFSLTASVVEPVQSHGVSAGSRIWLASSFAF